MLGNLPLLNIVHFVTMVNELRMVVSTDVRVSDLVDCVENSCFMEHLFWDHGTLFLIR
jgi:hypothetical protein